MNTVAASFNTAVRQTTKMSQQKRKPRLECYAKTSHMKVNKSNFKKSLQRQ